MVPGVPVAPLCCKPLLGNNLQQVPKTVEVDMAIWCSDNHFETVWAPVPTKLNPGYAPEPRNQF